MDILQAIVLGLIQGLGEFLPISSSGHLVLTPWLFGWEDQGLSFDVALHFGTLIAVVGFFWREWVAIFCSFFGIKSKLCGEEKYPSHFLPFLVIGTIPGALLGFLLEEKVSTVLRSPYIVVASLIFFGGLLYLADLKSKKLKETKLIKLRDAILIGCAQALAIIPGTSRSGITITAALALGFDRKSAAKFSFLLSTPIVFGAAVYKSKDLITNGITNIEILGVLVAAISGFFAIAGLLKFVEKVSYKVFFWYRLLLALVILIVIFVR